MTLLGYCESGLDPLFQTGLHEFDFGNKFYTARIRKARPLIRGEFEAFNHDLGNEFDGESACQSDKGFVLVITV